ncbi:MAG: ATP-binding protein [Candidatus Gracilibacteria bacterium]|jgi:predicted AAA+ superfamily ATPase|nr:ATP-binding protein [Candidatus Gracilibacteria bacterium]
MIKRTYSLDKIIKKGKVLIIYGPRQVGKTTLIKEFIKNSKLTYRYDTGDGFQIQNELSKCTYESTDNHVGNYDLIIIDEAQKIPNIGNALKLMVDSHPNKYFIATGSSSFDLANKTDESLTGRKIVIKLFPISYFELSKTMAVSEMKNSLEKNLIYGSYPELLMAKTNQEKEQIIRLLSDSYLIKDILEFDRIKRADVIMKLLKLLAFQIGSEVSANELGRSLGVDTKTILYYLDLLEKSFVIFGLSGYSGNLRKEITKMSKYYFYDNGIRNALILNFNRLEDRNDIGQLWENFLMIERRKRNEYKNAFPAYYFWRTYSKQEIDLIEEKQGFLSAYEFKWKAQKSSSPSEWRANYKNSKYLEINADNYINFIT